MEKEETGERTFCNHRCCKMASKCCFTLKYSWRRLPKKNPMIESWSEVCQKFRFFFFFFLVGGCCEGIIFSIFDVVNPSCWLIANGNAPGSRTICSLVDGLYFAYMAGRACRVLSSVKQSWWDWCWNHLDLSDSFFTKTSIDFHQIL